MLYRASDQAHAAPCHQAHGKERLQARRGEDLGINPSFHRCMERMIDHEVYQGRPLDTAFFISSRHRRRRKNLDELISIKAARKQQAEYFTTRSNRVRPHKRRRTNAAAQTPIGTGAW
jgi:hypothetical protein